MPLGKLNKPGRTYVFKSKSSNNHRKSGKIHAQLV